MRLFLVVVTLLAAFGCTGPGFSGGGDERSGVAVPPRADLVDEDVGAILSGMARAQARRARAGL